MFHGSDVTLQSDPQSEQVHSGTITVNVSAFAHWKKSVADLTELT